MSPPISVLYKVEDIPRAGRGIVASARIPTGTVLLNSSAPAAHVILRQYRKEVCAHCFAYDLGRSLPVRDGEIGKVYCSDRCQATWRERHGDLGVEAWRALHAFVQSKGKAIVDVCCIASVSSKPTLAEVKASWYRADVKCKRQTGSTTHVDGAKPRKIKNSSLTSKIDPDVLGYLLSGILFHHHHPDTWQEGVLDLALDETPYRSTADLEAHCTSFLQLLSILPHALRPSCSSAVCQTLANAGSHNAFGLRSGSDDGEEYMGYGLYPTASYFNHSCEPNVAKRRVGSSWEFWSARDIEPGEECCITYLGGDERDLTVAERRARLQEAWGFECMCERCSREAGE